MNNKICFIGGNISKAMEGSVVGGAEKQQALIIQGIKSIGHDIIVLEYKLKKIKVIDGIKFYPAWNEGKRSFLNKIKDIINQLNKHEISIVYARGTDLYVAYLYFILKVIRSQIKLYWGLAGDHDLTAKFNHLRVSHASSLYGKFNAGVMFNISSLFLFLFSDTIICQTQEQAKTCKSKWKKKSVAFISNIFLDCHKKNIFCSKTIQADAIWIGKFSGIKGEDILLKVAKDIPNMKIICLGHVTDSFKKTKIYEEIKNQNNLILVGRVPASKVSSYISMADFVLNTSPSEGFSNVFLEGWDQKKPVVSYKVNPNQYLTQGKAGYCAQNSYSKLIKKLHEILKDRIFMSYHGNKGKEILKKNHLPKVILPKYYKLFSDLS